MPKPKAKYERIRFELYPSPELRAALNRAAERLGVEDASLAKVLLGFALGVESHVLEVVSLLSKGAQEPARKPRR